MDEYKRISCVINDEDCNDANTCDDCYIVIEERLRKQKEIDAKYNLDNITKIGLREYKGNHNYTVIKADLNELEFLKTAIKMENPEEISQDKYDEMNLAKYYPEWEKTKEVLKITEIPDKYLFEMGKAIIVFFSNEIYVIAPRIEE